jgi:hypothetical protein
MTTDKKNTKLRFIVADRGSVPTGRHGKHNEIVTAIFRDLSSLADGKVLKIPLDELNDTKVNVRSAVSRAARKQRKEVSTAADDQFLYVWNS